MMIRNAVRWGAGLAVVMLTLGCQGAQGEAGPPGQQGPSGDAGPFVPETSTVTGTVTDGKSPLTGVAVTTHPAAAPATTDGAGAFTLPGLDVGVYDLTFHLAGFVDATLTVAVPLGAPVSVSVALARDADGEGGPAVTVVDQLTAGYAAAVTLQAQVSGDGPFTYAWSQTGGPAAVLTGTDTATLGFTTQDFLTSVGATTLANARFDVLGLDPDQANGYGFQLLVTDANGLTTTTAAAASATRPSPGLRMVPLGVPVRLQGNGPLIPIGTPPAPQASWSWTLDTSGAAGSKATLLLATSQFPTFTPDVVGVYVVGETVAGQSMKLYGGTWLGEMTAAAQVNCLLCHNGTIAPAKFPLWEQTAHYSAMQRKLDGAEGQGFTAGCLPCHTVGYDGSAKNNGFDDVEATAGWTVPAQDKPGNWVALEAVPSLGQLAGIQCESCHGPQATTTAGPHANVTNPDQPARISWSAAVCATCHQESPTYYQAAQWASSKHSDRTLSILEATVENRGTTAAHCGRCHAAQGFARYASQLNAGYSGLLTTDGNPPAPGSPSPNAATVPFLTGIGLTIASVESPTCSACHDPHDATNPSQLRVYDSVASLPNGMNGVSGMGTGMICASCHNTRNGEHSDFVAAPTSYEAPHAAAQTDVVFGFNAYFVERYAPSVHLAVANTCAGCHYKAVTASEVAAQQTSSHSFVVDNTVCATCHAASIDGAALEAGYQAQLDALGVAIAGKVEDLIVAALLPAGGAGYQVRAWDPTSGDYSSTGASNVLLTAAPTSIDHMEIAGQIGFILHLPAPVTVALVDGTGAPAGSLQTADLYVPAGSILSNAATPAALFAPSSDYYRALWNYYLLDDDGTKGIHNPTFFSSVISATSAKVAALP